VQQGVLLLEKLVYNGVITNHCAISALIPID